MIIPKKLEAKNRDTISQYAIAKDMYQVLVAFKILEDGESTPSAYTNSYGHLIFDVKMDFTSKSRWVKDENHTLDPET